ISDGNGGTDTATVTVTINPVNDEPDATNNNQSVTKTEATTTGNIINDNDGDGVDSDIDGDSLNITNINSTPINTANTQVPGSFGTLTINPDGSYEYEVDTTNSNVQALGDSETLTETFTYTVSDGNGGTDTAVLTITVSGSNNAPIATDNNNSVDEDQTTPATGNVINDDNGDGIDGDPNDDTLTVTTVNSEPVTDNTEVSGTFGKLTINPDGSYEYDVDETNPTVQALGDSETLTETFTYTISDGKGGTNAAELTITINGVNDTPVANDDNITTGENTPVTIDVDNNDTDIEDGIPTGRIEIINEPTNGTVEIDDNGTPDDPSDDQVIYKPNNNFTGEDTFTYTITDSDGATSNPATVTVNVAEINDKPVAVDDTADTDEETPVTIDIVNNDTDDEDGTPTGQITIIDQPTNGTVEIDDNGTPDNFSDDQVIYTPDPEFAGEDTFTYNVNDSNDVTSNPATVTVNVNPVNDKPVANDDGATTSEETPVTINIRENDTDIEDEIPTGVINIIDQPTNGTVEIDDNGTPDNPSDDQVIYTPNQNFIGTETFTYTIEDSEGDASDPATVTVSVGGVNDQPVANNDAFTTPEDTPVTVNVRENDIGTDTDTEDVIPKGKITIVNQPENGTVEIDDKGTPDDFSDDEVIYTPDENFDGEDTFTYTIEDSDGLPSNTATVTIGITPPVNDIPVANDEGVVTAEDTPVTIDVVANDTDPEDGTPTGQITIIDQPTNGTVEIDDKGTPNDFSDDEVIYTPNPEFNGTDTFTYTVKDSEGESSSPATVTVDVESINDTPVANNDTATTSENTPLTVDVRNNDTDVEDDVPTGVINIIDQPTNGTLEIDDKGNNDPSDDEFVYTPNEGFVGTETFTYTIEDSEGQPSSVATVTVTVNETVDETNNPIANNDSTITLANTSTTINLVENDTDDGEVIPSSLTIVENPGNGVLSINEDGTVEYTPNPEFIGEETFTYTITDNEGNISEPATVTILVQSPSQDTDNDGIPDVDDLDDDNDGIPDAEDGPGDTDGDGIPDSLDLDSDNDGLSDLVESGLTPEKIAELDTDGDGVIDPTNEFGDNGLADVIETSPESGQLDLDGDGIVDEPVDTDGDGVPDNLDLDSDNDGLNDIVESGDTDGDNVPDFRDLDSDNDGINDIIEGGLTDPDGDGVVNGADNDGDGILDQADPDDNNFGGNEDELAPDTDGDGTPDYQDLDSDNDGENDIIEAGIADPEGDGVVNGPDNDGDGIPDAVDLNDEGFGDIPSDDDLPDEDGDGIPDFQDLNTTPVAEDDEVTITANTALNISVLENDRDSDDDPLSLVEFDGTSANGGEIVLDGDILRYIPAPGFTGVDTFTYTISDGKGDIDTATVTITVTETELTPEPEPTPVPEPTPTPSPSEEVEDDLVGTGEETPIANRPPVAVNDNQLLTSDRSVTLDVLGNDSDPDGDAFSLHEFDTVSANGGTISLDGDQLVYTPPAGFEGTDTFTYSIIDTQGGIGTATVTLTVQPESAEPVETTCCGSCPVAPTLEPIVLPEEPLFEADLLPELPNANNANISDSNSNDTLDGTDNADLINASAGSDRIIAFANNDTLLAGAGDDFGFAGQGDDLLFGDTGNDQLWGDAENDTLIGGPSGTQPLGNIGEQDTLYGNVGEDLLEGSLGQDILHGGQGNDIAHGGKDDDQVMGELGNDTLLGEQGNDTLLGGTTNDTVEDVNGTDLLLGGAGDDWLNGNQGNDTLVAGEGNDELHGGKDDDLLYGNTGDDTLAGELGNDTLIAGPSGDEPLGETGDRDVLFGYEGDDWLSGNLGRDTLHGGAGNDRAHGGKDNDWVIGEIGNDTLVGEQGDDTILGGTSNDANDPVRDLNGADLLFGEGGNDWMDGNEGNDTLVGGDGNDTTHGGQNDDLLYGDAGNDELMGDRGDDTLCGGSGDDTLTGGSGNDTLTGGEGNDSFVLNANSGSDVITDFQIGQNRLVLGEGLTLSQLDVNQDGSNTTITLDNQLIATLLDVDATAILDSNTFL
ncbi:MAG: Ig-like domain-containing protein, partial [Cyanobacteria bacterium J06592_8]